MHTECIKLNGWSEEFACACVSMTVCTLACVGLHGSGGMTKIGKLFSSSGESFSEFFGLLMLVGRQGNITDDNDAFH